MSRQQMPEQDNDCDFGWTPEAQEEYETYCREQKDIPPWEVTRDDFLESRK